MFRKITYFFMLAAAVFVSLTACDGFIAAQRAIEREAEAHSRGKAALAECIATQCETLDIDGMRLEDYSVINSLSHVTILMASRTSFDTLDDIQDMHQLEELHITSTRITDLAGLENFPQLKVLHIERMPEDLDISPIGQLTGLTELALGSLGENSDASFIQNMRSLERLKITWAWNSEADLSVLRGHPTLRSLNIYGDLPTDQSALLTMRRLESIFFGKYRSLNAGVREELERRGVFSEPLVIVVC